MDIQGGQAVTFVGAIHRWDQDGNLLKKVDPKAKIDAPEVDYTAAKDTAARSGAAKDAAAKDAAARWVFKDLPPGKYDLVILAGPRVRVEGFEFAPVQEFDPFYPGDATIDNATRDLIAADIKKSPQYENRVEPLAMGAGKAEHSPVRVLLMLIRDQATSYESEMPGAATMRFEIWQYTWNYGGWAKDRRTKVLDRVLLPRDELRRWTWLWDPKLGGIEVKSSPLTIQYTLQPGSTEEEAQGAVPLLRDQEGWPPTASGGQVRPLRVGWLLRACESA